MKQIEDVVTEAAKKAHWWFTAMLAGAVGLLLCGMGIAAYVGGFARAETVAGHEKRLTRIEAHDESRDRYDVEWKRWMGEQVMQIGVQVHASVASPPAAPPTVDAGVR